MSNRSLWWIVAAAAGVLIVISAIARQHAGSATGVASREEPPLQDPLPQPGPAPSFSPAPVRRFDPEPVPLEPKAPPPQPTTRPAATRPVRVATFKQAVADEELTPQKVARVALSYVGADPAANLVWEAAINNPNFTPNERKDLIEDLNEEGFEDPKNLTAADLPLIVSRIQLIENLAPHAADEVNAAAFAEAYKDLVNMAAKLTK